MLGLIFAAFMAFVVFVGGAVCLPYGTGARVRWT
jgi:hypothetical protein